MGGYTEKYGGAMGQPRGKSDISDVSDISDSAAPLCYAAASLSDINDDFTKAVSQTNHITYNFEQLYLN